MSGLQGGENRDDRGGENKLVSDSQGGENREDQAGEMLLNQ